MLLKRMYKKTDGAVPTLDFVRVIHEGKPRHCFSTRLVATAIQEGWMALSEGKILMRVQPKDLAFRIEKVPGHYCCFCGERQAGEVSAREHVLFVHAKVGADEWPKDDPELKRNFHSLLAAKNMKSPDPANKAGYCQVNYYECMKVA